MRIAKSLRKYKFGKLQVPEYYDKFLLATKLNIGFSVLLIDKAIGCQWVCLFVCYLLPNGSSSWAEILKDDSSWNADGFKLKNFELSFAREP